MSKQIERIPFEPDFPWTSIDLFEALLTWWHRSGKIPPAVKNHIGPLVLTDEDLLVMVKSLYEEVKA